MKKIIKATAALLAAALAGCSSAAATTTTATANDHLAKIKAADKLTIGLEGDWQPFSYHDSTNTLVGYDVEVGREVAQRIGVKAEIVEAAWDGLFAGLSAGTYDVVINGVDVTDEREKTFSFSDPYAYDHTVLVTKADNKTINSFEDIKGLKTANSIGSTYMEIGEQYGATVSGVDTLAETMELVLNGTVDATINAQTSVQDYLKTTGETRLRVAAVSSDATSYAIPMIKNSDNTTLVEAVNQALQEMRDDGTLAKLSQKYFGADLTNK
jgi:cystine transport system substrate-binding protein